MKKILNLLVLSAMALSLTNIMSVAKENQNELAQSTNISNAQIKKLEQIEKKKNQQTANAILKISKMKSNIDIPHEDVKAYQDKIFSQINKDYEKSLNSILSGEQKNNYLQTKTVY